MGNTRISIVVNKSADLDEVRQKAEQLGLAETVSMPILRILHGHIDPSRYGDLRLIEGVDAVQPAEEFHLPPPDHPQ